jgi:hypothetical protein
VNFVEENEFPKPHYKRSLNMTTTKNDQMVTTTVNLPTGMMTTFRSMAGLLGVSLSEFIRRAVEEQIRVTQGDAEYQNKVQEYLATQAAALTGSDSN